jgi:hypothetical protein
MKQIITPPRLPSLSSKLRVKVKSVLIVGTSQERRSEKKGEQSGKSNRAVMV